MKQKIFTSNLAKGGIDYLINYINTISDEITQNYINSKEEFVFTNKNLNLDKIRKDIGDENFIKKFHDIFNTQVVPSLKTISDDYMKKRLSNIIMTSLIGKLNAIFRDVFFKGIEVFLIHLKNKKYNVEWAYIHHPELGTYYGDCSYNKFENKIFRLKEILDEWIIYIENSRLKTRTLLGVNDFSFNKLEFKFIANPHMIETINFLIYQFLEYEYFNTYPEEINLILIDDYNYNEIFNLYKDCICQLIAGEKIDKEVDNRLDNKLTNKIKMNIKKHL